MTNRILRLMEMWCAQPGVPEYPQETACSNAISSPLNLSLHGFNPTPWWLQFALKGSSTVPQGLLHFRLALSQFLSHIQLSFTQAVCHGICQGGGRWDFQVLQCSLHSMLGTPLQGGLHHPNSNGRGVARCRRLGLGLL